MDTVTCLSNYALDQLHILLVMNSRAVQSKRLFYIFIQSFILLPQIQTTNIHTLNLFIFISDMYDPSYSEDVQEIYLDPPVWQPRTIVQNHVRPNRANRAVSNDASRGRHELVMRETVLSGPDVIPSHSYGYIDDELYDDEGLFYS